MLGSLRFRGSLSTVLTLAGTGLALALLAPALAQAAPLTAAERTERCANIRDVAADNGIASGYLFAGIAEAETNLSHCWTELDWACQGPVSIDCGGGPVVAGAGDGPCNLMQGGLGMFQFDGGTFEQTIERDGDGVLLLSGNVTRAVDFVVNMVMKSQYVQADTPAEAKAWLNQVEVGGEHWDAWIKTVTHYYNGCVPGSCGVYAQRYAHYDQAGRDAYDEQGPAFWQVELGVCEPIGNDPRLLEETDPCFTKGGPLPYWRVGIGGESNLHVWTGTIEGDEPVNFAEWNLTFAETGEYKVEVSTPGGTSTSARYVVRYAGMTDEIVVDQSQQDGFVELGTFVFDTEDGQGIFLGDTTADLASEKIVADAIRVTRVDAPVGPSGAGGGSSSSGPTGAGGAGGGDGFEDGGGDDGCSCSAGRAPSTGDAMPWLALAFVGLMRARRRR